QHQNQRLGEVQERKNEKRFFQNFQHDFICSIPYAWMRLPLAASSRMADGGLRFPLPNSAWTTGDLVRQRRCRGERRKQAEPNCPRYIPVPQQRGHLPPVE